VLERFRMQNEKPVSTPLANHFKLTKEMCPKTQEEIEYMFRVPYSSAVGSLMYAMVCTRPDITHAVGVVSRYMNNPGKEHWEAVLAAILISIFFFTICLHKVFELSLLVATFLSFAFAYLLFVFIFTASVKTHCWNSY
jgi:hypothetical protein